MKRVVRSTYRWIYGIPLLVLFLLMVLAANLPRPAAGTHGAAPSAFFGWTFVIFLAWLILGRRVALWVLPLCISRLTCPGCGDELDTVGRWNCSCGYHDHRDKHILAGACPKCGNRIGHLNCPRCDCTLLLW